MNGNIGDKNIWLISVTIQDSIQVHNLTTTKVSSILNLRPTPGHVCSDFVTCASCTFCALFCPWDAKFLFQRVLGCNRIADLSLKIVFWTQKVAVGLIDMGNSDSHDP